MSIASLADYFVAQKQQVRYFKTNSPNSGYLYSSWTSGGNNVPSAGSAPAQSFTGFVPTVNTVGAAAIMPFTGLGYITQASVECSVSGRYWIVDRLFHFFQPSGVPNFTLVNQPSFASRIPNGDYTGLEIWYESTGGGGAPILTVTYTDQSGNTGHSTGAFGVNASGVGVASLFPLQAGDTGLQKIENVAISGNTGGYVVTVVRPLFRVSINLGNTEVYVPFPNTGLPQIFQDSCIHYYAEAVQFAGLFDLSMEIASL